MTVMDTLTGIACEGVITDLPAIPETGAVDCIIVQEGWGNTGYYGKEALKQAAESGTIFPANLRSFMGHPKDGVEEPAEGTVGYFTEAARYVESDPEAGGKATLRAPYMPFDDKRAFISQRAKVGSVALSLRAPIAYKMGEMEGKYGRVVTRFAAPAYSVDVVARPGAGGKFGVFKESALLGVDVSENQEGSEMPLTKEEMSAIAQETATAMSTALADSFKGITDALGKLTTAHESSAPKALPISDLLAKLDKAKLPEGPRKRILTAVESAEAGSADEKFVDELIARESEILTEALESVRAGVKAGTVTLDGDQGEPDEQRGTATESTTPRGWAKAVKA